MATETYKVDDLDSTKGAETHKLMLDNRTVAIDLAEGNYGTLAELLEPYFKAGKERTPAAGAGSTKLALVRTWLRQNGHSVNNMGRIPDDLMAIYDTAHEKSD